MAPTSGEWAYEPSPEEARLALDSLDTYIRRRTKENARFLFQDQIAPGQVDDTLSLLLDDGDFGVLGVPPAPSGNLWTIIYSPGSQMWRYICLPKSSFVLRVDQPEALAMNLGELFRSGEAEEATFLTQAEFAMDTMPFTIVGQGEVSGLTRYLATGRPFIPDVDHF